MSRQEFESQDNPSPEITPEIILAITPELIAANMQKARVLRSRTFLNGLRGAFKAFSEWKLSNFAARSKRSVNGSCRTSQRIAWRSCPNTCATICAWLSPQHRAFSVVR
jgi:hypothetical protein